MTWSSRIVALGFVFFATQARADWPQWGGTPSRNCVAEARNLPSEWNVGRFDRKTDRWIPDEAKNIRWVARLGSTTYGTPVLSDGKIFCATNNGAGYVPRYPAEVDLGCLLCFGQADGRFGWQLSREKLPGGSSVDWAEQGICCSPLVEGDRVWVVTNRCEVLCLDANGFYDSTNNGPYRDEPGTDRREADIVWQFDMMGRLGVVPHNMSSCSVTAAGDLLLVHTSNGIDGDHKKIPAPEAPSFIALDKQTGKLVWADNSPGANILHGQWSSPAFAVVEGVPQAIFPGGDGWVYSFRAAPTSDGKPELLWKFDCNPKTSAWKPGGMGDRANIIATPVVHEGRVYIATGHDPEFGQAPGILWCIDPTKRGDVSPELVVDAEGRRVAPRRLKAADPEAGDQVRPNPNSAAVWKYIGDDVNSDGSLDFEETMHRTLSMATIKDGLLVIADLAGLVQCLDAETGKLHWSYDMFSAVWGSALVADGKIFVGDEDGEVAVFEFSPKLKLLAENDVGSSVYSTPVAVDNVLYVATRTHLVAVQKDGAGN